MIDNYKVAVVQAAPAFMDLKKSVEKTIDLISLPHLYNYIRHTLCQLICWSVTIRYQPIMWSPS